MQVDSDKNSSNPDYTDLYIVACLITLRTPVFGKSSWKKLDPTVTLQTVSGAYL